MFAAILNSVAIGRSGSYEWALFNWRSVAFIGLFLSVWMSAFALVYTTYSTRHAYAELQSLRQQHDHLFMEWTQILLEQSAWADTGQIEQLAREDLSMRLPRLEEINFLVVTQ
jgi:cell division protein FtsL